MPIEFKGKKYVTEDDLRYTILGFWPQVLIDNPNLKEIFSEEFNREFLGGDDLISYAQPLVSGGMDFNALQEEILNDINNPEKGNLKDVLFKKTATGIGRGHSLGGLSGVVLGIHGTKMIDSGLTGLCSSRSLVTSSRRRETGTEDIAVPENLSKNPELLKEYMEMSSEVLEIAKDFKNKVGKMAGVETFNKVIPYNNPADLFIVLPLDTMATIVSESRADKLNPNGNFLPKEIHSLADKFDEITSQIGQNIMFRQRIEVPRDTYLHYNVFKDPSAPNRAAEIGKITRDFLKPQIIGKITELGFGFNSGLNALKEKLEKTRTINDPEKLHLASLEAMYFLRDFAQEYNEALRIQISDSLSWRVWSEQKRHATLKQNVESVYSGAKRAYNQTKDLWPEIKEIHNNKKEFSPELLGKLEKSFIIDDRLKRNSELLSPYVYHTVKQLMFYGKMLNEGFEERDSLFSVPKNIRLSTLENYDLVNLIDLEFPLRLCSTCEPERQKTSWEKREEIIKSFPSLEYFLEPKCGLGFCTEGKYCHRITDMREYNQDLHKATKEAMLKK